MDDRTTVLRLIGAFKLFKAILLAAAAVAAMRLLHRDIGEVIMRWALRLHFSPGNRHLQSLLAQFYSSPRELKLLPIVLSAYSAVFFVEGIGLILLQYWAEWVTVLTTAGLMPIELLEIYRRFTSLRLAIFAINLAIVVYLLRNLGGPRGDKLPATPSGT